MPNGTLSEAATTAVIHAWTQRDPLAAVGWIESFSDSAKRSRSLATLAAEWCADSPEDAASWVLQKQDQAEGAEIVESFIGTWGDQDPAAAAQWVMGLNETHQTEAAATLISLWAAHQPDVAAEWISRFPEGETRSSAIPSLARAWAGTEPAKAIEWCLSLADSSEKREALDDSARTWAALAPDELNQWLATQGPGTTPDRIRKVGADVIAEENPESAVKLAMQITNPAMQESAVLDSWKAWSKKDPQAANDWIGRAGLSPQLAARLVNSPSR